MIQQTLIPRAIEVESREAGAGQSMIRSRTSDPPDRLPTGTAPAAELQYVFGEEKNSAGDGGLCFGGLVKVTISRPCAGSANAGTPFQFARRPMNFAMGSSSSASASIVSPSK